MTFFDAMNRDSVSFLFTEGNDMAEGRSVDYASLLLGMRNGLVSNRRAMLMDNNINGVLSNQEKIDLIDRAIEDEKRLGFKPPVAVVGVQSNG